MNHPRNVGRSSPLDSVKSDWGYVNVRENAHMFWWLFFQDPTYQPTFLSKIDPIPVVVWLQVGANKKIALSQFYHFCFLLNIFYQSFNKRIFFFIKSAIQNNHK